MTLRATFDPALDPIPASTRVLRALALLSAAGVSVALAVQFIGMRARLPSFVSANTLRSHDRTLLIASLGAGVVVPLLGAGIVGLVLRRRAGAALEAAANLLSPAIAAALIPPLFCLGVWNSAPLKFLILLSVTVVLLRAALEQSFQAASRIEAPRWLRWPSAFLRWVVATLDRPRIGLALVTVGGLAYAVYTGYLEILKLHRLAMGSYDMGFFDNQMANSLSGRFFRNTLMYGPKGGSSIAGHAHFAHVLFLPLYALRPGSELLIALQAAFIGAATVPLYLFASTQIPRASAVLVALGFLLYAPLHGAQFYDFHWLLFASFFFFWMAYGIATERSWLVALSVVVILLLREDMSPGIAVLGLFLVVTGARPRLGAALLVTGVACFGLVKFVVMPAAGTWWFADIYKGFVPPGEKGYGAILKTLVANPGYVFTTLLTETKLTYVLHLFAPLAFLPWTRPALLLLASPAFFLTLLTTDYSAATSICYQYPGHWVPYLFMSTVLALRVTRESSGAPASRAAVAALLFGLFAHSVLFGVLFDPRSFQGGAGKVAPALTRAEAEQYRDVMALTRQIPPRASVIATEFEVPLVSARPDAYSAALHEADAEYMLLHKDHFVLEARAHLEGVLKRHPYGLLAQRGSVYLFRRDAVSPGTAAALSALGLRHD